jgi:hypothetical protein
VTVAVIGLEFGGCFCHGGRRWGTTVEFS